MIKRKDLLNKIGLHDQELSNSHRRFKLSFSQMNTQFKNQPPVVLITGGLAAGFILQTIGWRPAYSTLVLAYKLFPYLSSQLPQAPEM